MEKSATLSADLRQLTQALTTATGVSDVLHRVAEGLRRATGADAVYIEHRTLPGSEPQVVATTGPPAPPLGARPPYTDLLTTVAEKLPLEDDAGGPQGTVLLVRGSHGRARATGRRVALLLDVARVALHVSGLADEVRERRDEMERSTDEKFRLISGISHELRDTLGAASEYVQLLDTETELNERQRTYIESSRRAISGAVRLISDLLELARVEAGQLPVQHEPTSIGALLRDMASDYRLASATFGVELIAEIDADLPPVVTDPDLVGQILDNLFSNAVRYTPPNGSIHVHATRRRGRRTGDPAQWLCVSVTDTGPGIAEEHFVFEAVDRVSKRTGAAGFRLAINRNIARLLGGDLTLERGDAGGANFTLWLPYSETEAEAEAEAKPEAVRKRKRGDGAGNGGGGGGANGGASA
jgi:signal transduction histidine kinase